MEISISKRRKWKAFLDHGDIKNLSEVSGKDVRTIRRAIKDGLGSLETIQKIDEFIEEKKNAISK